MEVVWHWLPPEKWGIENPVSETGRLNDRYRGAILRARKEGREGWRYAVVSFDAVSGERWLTPLPVWEALERLQSLTGKQWCLFGRSGHRGSWAKLHVNVLVFRDP